MADVEALFTAALRFETAAQRSAFLERACAGAPEVRRRIEDLLSAHSQAGGFLEDSAVPSTAQAEVEEISEGPGTQIGNYVLRERLGEGGFGVVYLAEQTEPVRREVAIKIIKLGMDTKQVVARFQAERQAQALTDHPNIAKVLHAGATATGRPYYVMELVRGLPLLAYCDRHRLTIAERLALFVDICHAVQHAHHKGLIHRDLKPSNVLVAIQEGHPVPKVIDFGVVKATTGRLTTMTLHTELGQLIGTPVYMSPEQAELSELDVDTRTDVYSLGALLFELLTGTTPFEASRLRECGLVEIQRILREEDPPHPSARVQRLEAELSEVAQARKLDPGALAARLRGDLDWIVGKALEKDRTRRYETPDALAADVLRHSRGQPVLARPPSALYVFGKFVRRHRLPVFAATCVTLALLLGATFAAWALVRALDARDEARARSAFLEELLAFRTADLTSREFIERAREVYGADHSAVAAALALAAERFEETGELGRAEEHLTAALELWSAQGSAGGLNLAHAQRRLGGLAHLQGRTSEAEEHLRRAIALGERATTTPTRFLTDARAELAALLMRRAEYEGAVNELERVLAGRTAATPGAHALLGRTLEDLADALEADGRAAQAAERRQEALREFGLAWPESVMLADRSLQMGAALSQLPGFTRGDASAEELLRTGIRIYRGNPELQGVQYLAGLSELIELLESRGGGAAQREADALHAEWLVLLRRLHGPDSLERARLLEQRVERLASRGRVAEAARLGKEVVEIQARASGRPVEATEVGPEILTLPGRIAEREDADPETYELARKLLDLILPGDTLTAAFLALRMRDFEHTERLLEPAVQGVRPEQAGARKLLLFAMAQTGLGRRELARVYLNRAREELQRHGGIGDPAVMALLREAEAVIEGEER